MDSAHKHGAGDDDIRHAIDHAIRVHAMDGYLLLATIAATIVTLIGRSQPKAAHSNDRDRPDDVPPGQAG